jgi:hypothetical protein
MRCGIGQAVVAATAATALMLGLAGCLAPSVSESSRHPGHGVAWLVRRGLSQGFQLGDSAVETVAASGGYLVDLLKIPGSGEAYGTIGPTLTVRDLASGRRLWTLGSVPGMPAVTAHNLYIGKSGYNLRTGSRFAIPVRIPPGSVPDPTGGLLAIAGPRAHRSLVSLNPRTGVARWRVPSPRRPWLCGQIAASRAAVAVMRCGPLGRGQHATFVVKEVDCFDPVNGRLRWKHPFFRGVVPLSDVHAIVAGRTVLVADQPGGPWSAWDSMTGAAPRGISWLSNWMRSRPYQLLVGLGPGQTAVLGRTDADVLAFQALSLVDLKHGRVLWTAPVPHPFGRLTVGITRGRLYELNGSELTAVSFRTGAVIGHVSLPASFVGVEPGRQAELVPGDTDGPADVIAGSQHEALLVHGLLVARTRGSGLAAIRIGTLVR